MECPSCHQHGEPRGIGFTWWGGVLGPKLLNHVECTACGARFNRKTGRDNKRAIMMYMIVASLLVLALFGALLVTVWKR
ncbi:MAG: hypothetical protein WKG01_29595 [Kofleriaceae bacterium]